MNRKAKTSSATLIATLAGGLLGSPAHAQDRHFYWKTSQLSKVWHSELSWIPGPNAVGTPYNSGSIAHINWGNVLVGSSHCSGGRMQIEGGDVSLIGNRTFMPSKPDLILVNEHAITVVSEAKLRVLSGTHLGFWDDPRYSNARSWVKLIVDGEFFMNGAFSGSTNIHLMGSGTTHLLGDPYQLTGELVLEGFHTLTAGGNDTLRDDGRVRLNSPSATLRIIDDESVGTVHGTGQIELDPGVVLTVGAGYPGTWHLMGKIRGQGSLSVNTPSTDWYWLHSIADHTGGTTVAPGSKLMVIGALPSDAGDIVNNGQIMFDQAVQTHINGIIGGPGTIELSNNSAIAFNGTSTYSGGTTISADSTLYANGPDATGTGPVDVWGTLGGGGLARGQINLHPGGLIDPGSFDVFERLAVGPLDLSANNATVKFDLGGTEPTKYDSLRSMQLKLGGTLDLRGHAWMPSVGESFTIITAPISMEGRFDSISFPDNGSDWFIDYAYVDSNWTVTVSKDNDCNTNGIADSREIEHPQASQDFSGAPGATYTMNGTGVVDAGSLRLTEAVGSTSGSVIFETLSPNPVDDFVATFDFKMGGGTGADGMSFALLDANVHASSALFGEKGPGAGSLVVSLDTYSGGPAANFVEFLYNGVSLATVNPTFQLDNDSWNTAMVSLRDGQLTMYLQETGGALELVVHNLAIPSFTPTEARFGFGARTGGLTNEHRVDNVRFSDESNTNDCNNNGVPDQCDPDLNANGIPDDCEACYADCDPSTGAGTLDIFDFLCFQNSFVAAEPYACECDTSTGVGVCDIFDFLCFQNAFVGGCP